MPDRYFKLCRKADFSSCRPFIKIKDSFKKIIITSNTPKPFYNEDGILIMSVYDFLLNPDSLEF